MTRRILVTGYGGFLGAEITRQLLQRGDQVVGLGRSHYPHLQALPIEQHQGDVRDLNTLLTSSRNVDAIIHTAAIAGVWGSWQKYHSVNTQGTLNVIEACRQNQIPILVHCSSPSVTFAAEDQAGINESAPYPDRWLCHYPHTKALAEQAVLAAHHPPKLATAALRPHLIWGADDPHLFPRLIDRAKSGRLRIVGDGTNQLDTVHVVNAAAAHLAALDTLQILVDPGSASLEDQQRAQQAGGRAYFITQDEPVQCWDWIRQVLQIAGAPLPMKHISFQAAWQLGALLELAYKLTGRTSEPPMTRFVAAQLAKDHYFDISAARKLLGYKPNFSMEMGLEELRTKWSKACSLP